MVCLIKTSQEYKEALDKSGLPEDKFYPIAFGEYNRTGKYPPNDVYPGADSSSKIEKDVHLKNGDSMEEEEILKRTNTSSTLEAQLVLNNKYRDKEIEISNNDLGISNVKILSRPTLLSRNDLPIEHAPKLLNDNIYFLNTIYRMADLYGLNFKTISNEELNLPEWMEKVPTGLNSNAFIYNNEIYLNVDNMKVDSPVHELLHMLFGSIRFTNPDMYYLLVNSVNQIPGYKEEFVKYPNRAESDVNEEILITLFSKFLTNQNSLFKNLDPKILYEIKYNIARTLDTIVFGKDSVNKMDMNKVLNLSIKDLSNILESNKLDDLGSIRLNDSFISRNLNNKILELSKRGDLKINCS